MFGYNERLTDFIVIEGIDGAGTSTQRQLLCRALEAAGKLVWDTWEPTDSAIGLVIRSALRGEIELANGTMARLFAADRNQHIEGNGGIRQALHRGALVVCDRYVLSSLAYQGLLLDDETVWRLNQDFPLPEFLLFIDVDANIGEKRRHIRGGIEEIYDKNSFQEKVRAAYHKHIDHLQAVRPDLKIGRFDGSQSIEKLHADICGFLDIAPI